MRLLIDGYNLLHATHIFGEGALAGTLQGSREALLAYLASKLSARERRWATIVFDAGGAPPGLPSETRYEGVRVCYARDFPDADAMLEALIEAARAPKDLLVVSSDRRVQRAARRRGASWVESDQWRRDLDTRPSTPSAGGAAKPPVDQSPGEIDHWVRTFSEGAPSEASPPQPREDPAPRNEAADPESPFPPGYADDLAAELEPRDPPGADDA